MLPVTEHDGALAVTLSGVRGQLAHDLSAGASVRPALEVMVDDFARFHAVMAWLSAIAALLLLGIGLALWRRARATGSDIRTRRVVRSYAAVAALVGVALVAVAAANTATAAEPAPALLNFFEGSF